MIDLDWTNWNEWGRLTVCRFGISIQDSFNIKLERVTIRGRLKLDPSEVMDVRFGRSNINSFISILLSIFNEQDESSLPSNATSPNSMEYKSGRSIH